ncbi:MAG TPA: DUF202 domain-containing protein [Ilumatobacter sp.]
MRIERPTVVFDAGLQHERTSLAWERTAIAWMVAGVLLARYAAATAHWVFAFVGMTQVAAGGVILLWAARHYENLHGRLRAGESPVHPIAAMTTGVATILFTGFGTVFALTVSFAR